MTKIAIFGVGLIGGSLALNFKGKPGVTVVGLSNNPASVEKYVRLGVVDAATTSVAEAAEDADFIFICCPVGLIDSYLTQLAALPLKSGCVITDVGSTKASIVRAAGELDFGQAHFIGGHPMAGSERSGVEVANINLFENAFYILTPTDKTPEPAFERLADLIAWTRAQIVRIEAGLHDNIAAAVSHLPHLIAVALVNQIARYNESDTLYQRLAAGGFRDITRIASSDPIMWRDTLIDNRMILLDMLEDWNMQIEHFIQLLENADGEGIEREFLTAGEFRNRLPERSKGVIGSQFDLYIDVPDNPGVIGQIAGLLGNHQINLSNIQIMESRSDVPGVLRLSFRSREHQDRAAQLLEPNYTVRR
ncbi:MAG: prephenate dehydrogenase [Paenibacillaceae bacterium]|jgi:prephenate dehydrogenase|nr:prephenate dehydrogenase [Paenibacillaceae bacterium]